MPVVFRLASATAGRHRCRPGLATPARRPGHPRAAGDGCPVLSIGGVFRPPPQHRRWRAGARPYRLAPARRPLRAASGVTLRWVAFSKPEPRRSSGRDHPPDEGKVREEDQTETAAAASLLDHARDRGSGEDRGAVAPERRPHTGNQRQRRHRPRLRSILHRRGGRGRSPWPGSAPRRPYRPPAGRAKRRHGIVLQADAARQPRLRRRPQIPRHHHRRLPYRHGRRRSADRLHRQSAIWEERQPRGTLLQPCRARGERHRVHRAALVPQGVGREPPRSQLPPRSRGAGAGQRLPVPGQAVQRAGSSRFGSAGPSRGPCGGARRRTPTSLS